MAFNPQQFAYNDDPMVAQNSRAMMVDTIGKMIAQMQASRTNPMQAKILQAHADLAPDLYKSEIMRNQSPYLQAQTGAAKQIIDANVLKKQLEVGLGAAKAQGDPSLIPAGYGDMSGIDQATQALQNTAGLGGGPPPLSPQGQTIANTMQGGQPPALPMSGSTGMPAQQLSDKQFEQVAQNYGPGAKEVPTQGAQPSSDLYQNPEVARQKAQSLALTFGPLGAGVGSPNVAGLQEKLATEGTPQTRSQVAMQQKMLETYNSQAQAAAQVKQLTQQARQILKDVPSWQLKGPISKLTISTLPFIGKDDLLNLKNINSQLIGFQTKLGDVGGRMTGLKGELQNLGSPADVSQNTVGSLGKSLDVMDKMADTATQNRQDAYKYLHEKGGLDEGFHPNQGNKPLTTSDMADNIIKSAKEVPGRGVLVVDHNQKDENGNPVRGYISLKKLKDNLLDPSKNYEVLNNG